MQMRITQGLRLPCQQNRVRVLQLCLNDKYSFASVLQVLRPSENVGRFSKRIVMLFSPSRIRVAAAAVMMLFATQTFAAPGDSQAVF